MIFVRNALQEAAVLDFLLYLVKIFLLKVGQKSFAICSEDVKTVIILRLTRALATFISTTVRKKTERETF